MSDTTYIALLRGINVGGHNVKMEQMRGLFAEMGFGNVRSYIQSGNIFFESADDDRSALRTTIEQRLRAALGYDVPTCLRTVDEIEALLALDPFRDVTLTDDMRLSVNFLAEPAARPLPLPYLTPDGAYEVIGQTAAEMFVVWRLQNGRPGNSYGLIERVARCPDDHSLLAHDGEDPVGGESGAHRENETDDDVLKPVGLNRLSGLIHAPGAHPEMRWFWPRRRPAREPTASGHRRARR